MPPAKLAPGKYRKITGNEAIAMGLVDRGEALPARTLFYAGYPITPASDILHELSMLKNFGVRTFQAEDEIAAMSSVIGAAFAGELAVTASSGPGICLKGEAIGLGVMTELPLVIIDVQRGGPSTGLPTKTEQADLLLAMFGRNGECPMPIVAAASARRLLRHGPEAMRIAVEFMTPVIFLTDGYIANGAEPWQIPKCRRPASRSKIKHPDRKQQRHRRMASSCRTSATRSWRGPWAMPGTPGLEHRIGGLEKADITGNIDYEPDNHEHMVKTRAQKVANIANSIPEQDGRRPENGRAAGRSVGAAPTAPSARPCEQCSADGKIGRPRPPALPEPVPEEPRRRS